MAAKRSQGQGTNFFLVLVGDEEEVALDAGDQDPQAAAGREDKGTG